MDLHPRVTLPAFVLAALSGATTVASRYLPALVHNAVPVRTLGSLVLAFAVLGFVLVPLLVIPFGYWAGRHANVSETYPSLLGVLALAGVAGYAAGGLVGGAVVFVLSSVGGRPLGFLFRALVLPLLTGTVQVVLGGFSGAALAQFQQG